MGHPPGLTGLALAARDEAIAPAMRGIGYGIARAPELRRDAVIDHVTEHVGALAVLDQPEGVAAELKIVPALIDAEGAVAFDINAAFDVAQHIIDSRLTGL